MLHPIFSVLAHRPDLVLNHLAAYAALAREEAQTTGTALARCAIAAVLAACAFLVFLMLAGMAAMLGVLQAQFHWVLVLVPGTVLALAVVAFLQARQGLPKSALTQLRAQLAADIETLRILGAA
ncbi:MAG: hypothetical protein RI884_595 [Pseudomonadota bacterium]